MRSGRSPRIPSGIRRWLCSLACAWIGLAGCAWSEERPHLGSFYSDGHDGFVYLPLGQPSFADQVVSFTVGKPAPTHERNMQPAQALGVPDYDKASDTGFLSLGCGGTVVLQFTDNALVDVDGVDLHVFEIGNAIEPTELEISADGKEWHAVGRIAGGRADVDIAGQADASDTYRFVRLTDLKQNCDPGTPGADIDAVAAIGAGLRLKLESRVLFDSGKAELKPEAKAAFIAVQQALASMPGARVMIEGHTDSVGSDTDNEALSQRRAQTVREYLMGSPGLSELEFEAHGYGETRPLASNEDAAGRSQNRRVEIIAVPPEMRKANSTSPIDGFWKTSEGQMVLASFDQGRKLFGRYTTDSGRVFFSVQERHLSGYWVESKSGQRCDSPRDGSSYWGHLEVDMDASWQKFSGWWSYCDSSKKAGDWTGERAP